MVPSRDNVVLEPLPPPADFRGACRGDVRHVDVSSEPQCHREPDPPYDGVLVEHIALGVEQYVLGKSQRPEVLVHAEGPRPFPDVRAPDAVIRAMPDDPLRGGEGPLLVPAAHVG